VPDQKPRSILEILRRDATFLSHLNIMDYSLLIGIHDPKVQRERSLSNPVPATSAHGSFTNHGAVADYNNQESNGKPVLFSEGGPGIMGIIDILQEYNLAKKMERFFKTVVLRQDRYGVSVMPPFEYSSRFQSRMYNIFISELSISECHL